MKRISAYEIRKQLYKQNQVSNSLADAVEFMMMFIVVMFVLLLGPSLILLSRSQAQPMAAEQTASFDTQLNEAKLKIQQYADDQVWLYSVTKQEGSFDTQLNEARTKIGK